MQLKKVLTLRTVVATSAGLTLASSSFVAAVQVAGFLAGDSAWLAILTGGILCLIAAACFSELNGMLPSAAGIRLYFSRAFNDNIALTISLFYMAVVLGVVGAESYVLANILNQVLPAVSPLLWIVAMFVIVCGMNIRGIKMAGNFQDIITYGLIASLVVMALVALVKLDFQLTTPVAPGGATALINAVAVGVFLFVGFEWVTPLAEEVTNIRLISRGMLVAVGLLSITYALFTVAMTASVPRELLVNSPTPHLVFAQTVFGGAGLAWMVGVSLASSITTFNAGLISVSRFIYASAREHVLPKLFSKISMRYFTPWVAIVTVFVAGTTISILVLLTKRYLVLVNMAAAMESVVYAFAGLAVIALRRKMPEAERPYRVWGGILIPALAVIIFTVLAFAVLFTDPLVGLYLTVGIILCWLYVSKVVPQLKHKHQTQRRAASKRRRRPTAETKETVAQLEKS